MQNIINRWGLTLRTLFNLLLVSLVAVVLAQLFNATFIQHNIVEFRNGLIFMFFQIPIIPILLAVTMLIMLLFTIPVDRLIQRHNFDLSNLSEKEIKLFHKKLSGIPFVIFSINILGFLIAPIFTAWIFPKMLGTFETDKCWLTWFYTTPIGIISSLWQIEKNNRYLVGIKEKMKLLDLRAKPKFYNSFRAKIFFLAFAALCLTTLPMIAIINFYLDQPTRALTASIEADYLNDEQMRTMLGDEDYEKLLKKDNSVYDKWRDAQWPEDVTITLSDLKARMISETEGVQKWALFRSFILLFITSIGLIRLATIVSGSHYRELQVLINRMDELVNDGNLNSRLSVINNNETGQLTAQINKFIAKLSDMIAHVAEVGKSVSNSSKDLDKQIASMNLALNHLQSSATDMSSSVDGQTEFINNSSTEIANFLTAVRQISEHVSTQASLIEESSASITQMSKGIDAVNQKVELAEKLSSHLKNVAENGELSVMTSVVQMQELTNMANDISEKVKGISKISAQTNMLAMNAAIEAAHAGDRGKGFAVVADEVRSLAEMAANISKDVINEIKNITAMIVDGAKVSEEAGQSFQAILADVRSNTEIISTISQAVSEQKMGVREVIEASSELVTSAEEIKNISSRQSESSKSMDKALSQMVDSTKTISQAITKQTEKSSEIISAIEEVNSVSQANVTIAEKLKTLIESFKI
ncbi:MAG: hypothetical protein JXR63_02630 [Spirochaetales bacterium]|nr:hypothetical protein [Spirochaetales bacterium]